MADLLHRHSRNVPGPFYVDDSCTDCDLCRALAPATFARDEETGWSYVHRQPTAPDEQELAVEARRSCPSDSIGDDGPPGPPP